MRTSSFFIPLLAVGSCGLFCATAGPPLQLGEETGSNPADTNACTLAGTLDPSALTAIPKWMRQHLHPKLLTPGHAPDDWQTIKAEYDKVNERAKTLSTKLKVQIAP
jgi:hypothetical protein